MYWNKTLLNHGSGLWPTTGIYGESMVPWRSPSQLKPSNHLEHKERCWHDNSRQRDIEAQTSVSRLTCVFGCPSLHSSGSPVSLRGCPWKHQHHKCTEPQSSRCEFEFLNNNNNNINDKTPAEAFDKVGGALGDLLWELDHIDASQYDVVGLHGIRAWKWRTAGWKGFVEFSRNLSNDMTVRGSIYLPLSSSNTRIPRDQQSAELSWPLFRMISGATYSGVPQKVQVFWPHLIFFANPKSTWGRTPGHCHDRLQNSLSRRRLLKWSEEFLQTFDNIFDHTHQTNYSTSQSLTTGSRETLSGVIWP